MTNCFSVTGGTIASLYAIVLIFWFLASKFTEVVRLDKKNGPGKNTLEQYGFSRTCMWFQLHTVTGHKFLEICSKLTLNIKFLVILS